MSRINPYGALIIIGLIAFVLYKFMVPDEKPVNVAPPKNINSGVIEGGNYLAREILTDEIVDSLEMLMKEKTGMFMEIRYYREAMTGEIWTVSVFTEPVGDLYTTMSADGSDVYEAFDIVLKAVTK